jgi:hypothetical protein
MTGLLLAPARQLVVLVTGASFACVRRIEDQMLAGPRRIAESGCKRRQFLVNYGHGNWRP